MRSAIWKLSALATVIGLGLVAVVMQNQGFSLSTSKPGDKTASTATAPAKPSVPKSQGDNSAAATTDSDPFGENSSGENASTPPAQTQVPDQGNDDPVTLAATDPEEKNDEEVFTSQGTQPRIKPRALNFKDKLDHDDQTGTEVAQVDEFSATAPRARVRNEALPPDRGPGTDPSDLEGTPPEDNGASPLTEEVDPFAERRKALQRTRNRARPNANQTEAESVRNPGESSQGAANPFEQGSGIDTESGPIVPVPGNARPNPHAKLIDDGDSMNAEPMGSAIPDAVDESQFEQSGTAPAGYREAAATTGTRGKSAAKPRPVIAEEDDINNGTAPKPPAGAPPAVPPAKAGVANKRSQFTAEDDGILGSKGAATTAPGLPSGVQPIPKIERDSSAGTDSTMPPAPPPATKSGRVRPNPFAEEGDGPGGLGVRTTAPNSAGKGVDRVETTPRGPVGSPDESISSLPKDHLGRPSKHILEIEPDNHPALTGTPDAAASHSSATEVIAAPQRLPATVNPPATGATYGGKGRVTIEKTAPPTAYVGQPLVYQIVVRNLGNGAAQQVVVEDLLPDGVTIQGSIPQGELTGRKLAWRIGALSAGEERKISVKVIPSSAGAIGSSATVKFVADQMLASADMADPEILPTTMTPRTAPGTTSRTAPRTSNGIQLEMQGPQQVGVGQSFEVRFRVTNRTGQPVNDVLVRNMLSSNLRHESRFRDLEYHVGTLAAGETRDMPLTLTATQAGRAVSRVMAMTGDDRVLHSDEFALEVTGGQGLPQAAASPAVPSLAVDVIPPPGPVQVGGRLVYEIRLINRGTVPARQAAVRLGVPSELKLVDAGPVRYRQEGADLVFDAIPILDAGQQTVLKAEFIAQAPGETILKVQYVGAHMKRPLSRDEGLMIGGR